jgi:hypothetical protein
MDELAYTIFMDGMKWRLGNSAQPSVALLDQHVTWMNNHFKDVYQSAVEDPTLQPSHAASTNLLAWLGWLWAIKNFSVTWGDTVVMPLYRGHGHGPFTPDKVESDCRCWCGHWKNILACGLTACGLFVHSRLACCLHTFCVTSQVPWTSHYFCYTFVYPLLSVQRSLLDKKKEN